MLEDVVILKHDGAPLKTCTRSNADMMLGLGIARLYQAEGDGPMKIILKVDPDQAEAPVSVLPSGSIGDAAQSYADRPAGHKKTARLAFSMDGRNSSAGRSKSE